MDRRFDDWTRRVIATPIGRRMALRGIAGVAMGLIAAHFPYLGDAKKRKKPVPNEFGCVDVGGKCRGNDANCCSGICQGKKPRKGKKDKSRCVAHNVLDCQAGATSCLEAVRCGANGAGQCFQTTGKADYCGVNGDCFSCAKDADCEPDFGPGAACIVCATECEETGGTQCFAAAD